MTNPTSASGTKRKPPSARAAGLLLAFAAASAIAAPFRPTADDQVLERLPARATDAAGRERLDLRRALGRSPRDAALAVRLASSYMQAVAAEGDPRLVGRAQAALAPWWDDAAPPVDVRVQRAILRQFNHQFDAASADLEAAVRQQPDHAQAWAWLAAVAMVQARYDRARAACAQLLELDESLSAAACAAAVDGATGRARDAVRALEDALEEHRDAGKDEQLWALTRLAEIRERLGDAAAAEAAFRQALGLGLADGYLQAAYADFLLDRGRAAEVLALLAGRERSDVLLLRLALAAKATRDRSLPTWTDALSARFAAARERGDAVHQKEEARFALAVLGDAGRALPLAERNFAVQREPADARLLLEAAIAAGRPAAAAPVLEWMRASGIESRALQSLAARLGAPR